MKQEGFFNSKERVTGFHRLFNTCTTCHNCGNLFPRFPRECTESHLTPANIRSRALQTEVELQSQCLQLEKLKSINSALQKDLVELRQELDNHCNKTKEATKEVLGKWSAKCEALRGSFKAAAAKNAEQEYSLVVLKQKLANLKVNVAKKGEANQKNGENDDQLRSELEQLEHYNQYLANEKRKKIISLVNKRVLRVAKKRKRSPRRNVYSRFGKKHYEPACNPIRDFVGKKFCFK